MIQPLKKVAAGFQFDLNTLLAKFDALETVRYSEFARFFREAKFSLIFSGRGYTGELRLLVEEMFPMVMKLLASSYTFYEKVFCVYMLYAMYSMQPLKPKLKLRLQLCHLIVVKELLEKCGKEQHLDVCFVINRLFLEKCFVYSASIQRMSPTMIPDKMEDPDSDTEVSAKVFSSMKMFGRDGPLEQMSHIHEQYVKMKNSQQSSDSVRKLAMISDNNFADFSRKIALLQAKYRAIEEGASKDREVVEDTSDEEYMEDIGARRTRLRNKLFRSVGNTRLQQRQDELLQQDYSSVNKVVDAGNTGTEEACGEAGGEADANPVPKKRGRPSKKAQESLQSGGKSDDLD